MSTYAKFPAIAAGVLPTNTTGVLTGLGTGTYTALGATYAVSNKMMDVLATFEITLGGSGVAEVELQIPGGYEMDTLYAVTEVGSLVVSDGNNITGRYEALPGTTSGSVMFGNLGPLTGLDTQTGDVYLIKLRFPVK